MNQAVVRANPASSYKLDVIGVDCPDCALKIEKAVKRMPGVVDAVMAFPDGRLNVAVEEGKTGAQDLVEKVRKLGYESQMSRDLSVLKKEKSRSDQNLVVMNNPHIYQLAITLLSLLSGIGAQIYGLAYPLPQMLYMAGIVAGAFQPAKNGIMMLFNARELDMNALMSLAVVGAVAIGELEEAAVVVFLFSLGNFLQSYTLAKTRISIKSLMGINPSQALVRKGEFEIFFPVEEIVVGDIVLVRPGERIPVDGLVEAGSSHVNQAPITGESLPVSKAMGDEVFAGSVNASGLLEIRATRRFQDNTINRIIAMIEDAQGKKAPYQELVDRFARHYTPAVLAAAILIAVLPSLLFNAPFEKWFYQSLGLLLVACPCALVISTPVSVVSALGSAARSGVLIKGGACLEKAGKLDVVTFDKTGTLTYGKLKVMEIQPFNGCSQSALLRIAAGLEFRSEHPVSKAVVSLARHAEIGIPKIVDFTAVPGKGATGIIDGRQYYIGSCNFMEELGVDAHAAESLIKKHHELGHIVALVSDTDKLLGILAASDELRPESQRAIEKLKRAGIRKTVMLTGDNEETARAVAAQTGVDEYQANMLPAGKLEAINALMKKYGNTAMVGDGINDAPAMAASTLGIAMGVAGTDAALETADIALMADDLNKLSYTIWLSRKTVRIIKQNITLALLIKGAILLLVIPGYLTLWLAIVGDMGSSLLVTLNGMRLLRMTHSGS